MNLAHKPVRLSLVWSREADPSPEFFKYAEPGRVQLRKKDFKVVSGSVAGTKNGRGAVALPRSFLFAALVVGAAFWGFVFWLVN